jgi:hypothetical protein
MEKESFVLLSSMAGRWAAATAISAARSIVI